MVRILILLTLCSNLYAANVPQAGSVVQMGQAVDSPNSALTLPISSLPSAFTLVAGFGGVVSGNFYSFVKLGAPGAQTQYKVTTGKTMYCQNVSISADGAGGVYLGYGTAALGTNNTATPPTGAIYFAADPTASVGGSTVGFLAGSFGAYKSYPMMLSYPAASFPFAKIINSGGVISFQMSCYEQ